MKYIVVEVARKDITQEIPLIFPNFCVHAVMFEMFKAQIMKENEHSITVSIKCVSAGEIQLTDHYGETTCYGKSTSLNIESRCGFDEKLFRMIDYTHGIL